MTTLKQLKLEAKNLKIPKYNQMNKSQLKSVLSDKEIIPEVVKEI